MAGPSTKGQMSQTEREQQIVPYIPNASLARELRGEITRDSDLDRVGELLEGTRNDEDPQLIRISGTSDTFTTGEDVVIHSIARTDQIIVDLEKHFGKDSMERRVLEWTRETDPLEKYHYDDASLAHMVIEKVRTKEGEGIFTIRTRKQYLPDFDSRDTVTPNHRSAGRGAVIETPFGPRWLVSITVVPSSYQRGRVLFGIKALLKLRLNPNISTLGYGAYLEVAQWPLPGPDDDYEILRNIDHKAFVPPRDELALLKEEMIRKKINGADPSSSDTAVTQTPSPRPTLMPPATKPTHVVDSTQAATPGPFRSRRSNTSDKSSSGTALAKLTKRSSHSDIQGPYSSYEQLAEASETDQDTDFTVVSERYKTPREQQQHLLERIAESMEEEVELQERVAHNTRERQGYVRELQRITELVHGDAHSRTAAKKLTSGPSSENRHSKKRRYSPDRLGGMKRIKN